MERSETPLKSSERTREGRHPLRDHPSEQAELQQNVAQKVMLQQTDARTALQDAQDRLQISYDKFAENERVGAGA
jgi:hypothetical protein